jgi:hypothetical protein
MAVAVPYRGRRAGFFRTVVGRGRARGPAIDNSESMARISALSRFSNAWFSARAIRVRSLAAIGVPSSADATPPIDRNRTQRASDEQPNSAQSVAPHAK